ncbi:MAG TPA: RICIN domain-containing protein [Opitutaceae bacterium]|nr:RICIN domain-containing protein [Opitutaceae bacterium]
MKAVSFLPLRRAFGRFFSFALVAGLLTLSTAHAFVHPGGLHNQADLDRMKAQVAAGAHPWINDWNVLIADPKAQNTYTAAPQANMGVSRQRCSQDAHAAYLNTIRWYISGDTSYADCAIRICNAWSSTVNQVPTGTDIPGLSGIPIAEFAIVGELLRISPRWAAADFARFKTMMINYWYPVCHDFLTNHNGACITNYWSNWDIANLGACIAIGVLCDDTAKYNEGVNYFMSGAGAGSIMNAVYYIHSGNLGQWQESGRDQEHAQLAVGMMAQACEIAWKQGLDLYGYSSNRLLAGAEYVAQYNLWKSVPYNFYNNCTNARQSWVSINGRGRLDDRPLWELLYNHYVVRKGLSAPNTTAMAQLMRPEHGSADHFGYGTLTFTLNASAYPPSPTPPAPTGLTATAGVGRVTLKWTRSGDTAQGYDLRRATTSGGPYTSIASWTNSTRCEQTDTSVTNGTTYYYVVAAKNQSGTSVASGQASATPIAAGALPSGWSRADIGSSGGSASYASVGNGTFVVGAAGSDFNGTSDSFTLVSKSVSGDCTITARLLVNGTSKGGIMMRASTAANAQALTMALGEAGGREARFRTRATAGGSTTVQLGNDYTWLPAWFRLQRAGNVFTAYESSDGVTWFSVGSSTVAMGSTYLVGVANVAGTATLDNVVVTGGGSGGSVPVGTYSLKNRASGKMLDNLGATADGATVAQWTDGSSNNQRWVLSYNGSYAKLQCVTGGKYLDSLGHAGNDTTVGQWASSTSTNQDWTIQDLGGGYYKLVNRSNGLCLDTGGGTANGDVVEFWGSGSSNNQQWQFVAP